MQKLTDSTNSGYFSSEETDSLLVTNPPKSKPSVLRQIKMNSANGPTTNSMTSTSCTKPTLMRQDRTSSYLTSPQLSQKARLGSDESDHSTHVAEDDAEQGLRTATVLDIEVYQEDQHHNKRKKHLQHHNTTLPNQQQLTVAAATSSYNAAPSQHLQQQQPTISITNLNHGSNLGTSYQNLSSCAISPSAQTRCRACRNCSRRASTTPLTNTSQMDRSISRGSVKSAFQQENLGSALVVYGGSNIPLPRNLPPVLVASSPTNGSRIIRQSSQPESSTMVICCGSHSSCGHSHTVPNVSLKQLRTDASQSDGIAGIAADSLRINGGMRPFKQNILKLLFSEGGRRGRKNPRNPGSMRQKYAGRYRSPYSGHYAPTRHQPMPHAQHMAPCGAQMAPCVSQMAPCGPQIAPYGPQMAPYEPQMAPYGPQMAPYGPQMAPYGPQMAPYGPQMVPYGPQMAHGPHVAPYGPQMPHGPHMTPYGPQIAHGPHMAAYGAQMAPCTPSSAEGSEAVPGKLIESKKGSPPKQNDVEELQSQFKDFDLV